ncbi:unnamed protein product [Aphanomyces euteiches]|uniref:DUF7492 domain-containing protein n=2 Tax=Aphanomyces euteiches TaxID=100861 RepID=A0A6G0WA85_9STRA|nr:hypothetical protein Ae201684_017628 [Aphanomyces euteiches]KAH9075860.1 hypothetical protein Ae201684P_012353 [Aphanomyces euteiches]KAH9144683.1 hypothetical protein AeRB84_011371 [Aphanomyces euteiches]
MLALQYLALDVLQLGNAVAHSWVDSLWCETPSMLGYPRSYLNRTESRAALGNVAFDRAMTYRIENYKSLSPLCSPSQEHPRQFDRYPRLTCPLGAIVHFAYSPNGHVAKDRCQPHDPRGCDGIYPPPTTWYVLWHMTRNKTLQRGDLPKPFNGTLESNTVPLVVIGQGPYDDGVCGEEPKNGKARLGANFPCRGTFQLPKNATNQRMSLIWFWAFDRTYGVGEEYTTCFDIDVLDASKKASKSPR